MIRPLALLIVGSLGWLGCASTQTLPSQAPVCSADQNTAIPDVRPDHQTTAFWLAKLADRQADKLLMAPQAIAALNARNQDNPAAFQDVTAPNFVTEEQTKSDIRDRFEWLQKRLDSGKYVESAPNMLQEAHARTFSASPADEIRLIHKESTLYCVPSLGGLYTQPIDRDFNRNHCSGLHPGEVARVLRTTEDGWNYVHVGHSVGWVHQDTLTPPITAKEAANYRNHTPRAVVVADKFMADNSVVLRWGTHVPLLSFTDKKGFEILVPTAKGLKRVTAPPSSPLQEGPLPLTRRNVFSLAFALQDTPYGWGGRQGGRDCSRYLLDLFGAFGLELGRHSGAQSRSGHVTVELKGLSPAHKREAIRNAHQRGLVLLYMPGHIMLYVGETSEEAFAVSSLSEYLEPCEQHGHHIVRVDRVAVTTLELGQGTERTSFLERLHRLAVFGP